MEKRDLDVFLDAFRELEADLALLSGLKGDFVSYSRALQAVYDRKLSFAVTEGDNFPFLKAAGEFRNLVVHNNDIALPTQGFLDRFLALSKAIRFPARMMDIWTPRSEMMTAGLTDNVLSLAQSMALRGLSYVPVMDGDGLVGVFSMSTFFDRFLTEGSYSLDGRLTVSDFSKEIGFDAHRGEAFAFVKKTDAVFPLGRSIQAKQKAHDKRVGALIVTSNGKPSGRLEGIVTATDLLKLKANG